MLFNLSLLFLQIFLTHVQALEKTSLDLPELAGNVTVLEKDEDKISAISHSSCLLVYPKPASWTTKQAKKVQEVLSSKGYRVLFIDEKTTGEDVFTRSGNNLLFLRSYAYLNKETGVSSNDPAYDVEVAVYVPIDLRSGSRSVYALNIKQYQKALTADTMREWVRDRKSVISENVALEPIVFERSEHVGRYKYDWEMEAMKRLPTCKTHFQLSELME